MTVKFPIVIATVVFWGGAVLYSRPPRAGRAELPQERLREANAVLHDLEQAVASHWPGSRAFLYGSIVPGLATVGGDVDCTILLADRVYSDQALTDSATNALLLYPRLFAHIQKVPIKTEIPVVTFVHVPTQLHVDLTINNYNGLQISKLLKYLLHRDERIYRLALIVKQWARRGPLTGPRALPSYGMQLLVLFYLQRRALLPPVAALQAAAPALLADNWNVAFRELQHQHVPKQSVPLTSLLAGFLEFYEQFDYDKYIICPYTGYPVKKDLFSHINTVPREFSLYSQNVKSNVTRPLSIDSKLVIQNIFILNMNIAERLDPNSFLKIKNFFQDSAQEFRNHRDVFSSKYLNNSEMST